MALWAPLGEYNSALLNNDKNGSLIVPVWGIQDKSTKAKWNVANEQ